jgi:hypothetical protein
MITKAMFGRVVMNIDRQHPLVYIFMAGQWPGC